MTKWDEMREELMATKTVKQLKAIAKAEGVCLGYDGSRKDSCAAAIVAFRRNREMNARGGGR